MHAINFLDSTNKVEFPLTNLFSNTSNDSIGYSTTYTYFSAKEFPR